MVESSRIEFVKLIGKEFAPYKSEIAKLRIEVFKDFPYLYEGDLQYEKEYLKVYENSERSITVLAKYENEFIGATTAIPLIDENENVKLPFENRDMPIEKIFYFGESILKKRFRGLGIGKQFFSFRENHAISYGTFDVTCFCAVNRPSDHKDKPIDYIPLDDFWVKLGYKKEPELISTFSWKDIGEKEETKKQMTYWLKKWNR